MTRITDKDLEAAVERLNSFSKKTYVISYAYGRVRLQQKGKGTCIERDVSPRLPRPQLYDIVWTIIEYVTSENREAKK